MYLFFETIKIVDGVIQNLEYHQKRVDETINCKYSIDNKHILRNIIIVPEKNSVGVVKCKFEYNLENYKMSFSDYKMIEIHSLKLVKSDTIEYNYKYINRSVIEKLLEKREDCDDIIIVKNNKITDTSFSNLILFDGYKWVTPDSSLLNGTCRRRLLEQGRIEAKPVYMDEIYNYKSLVLINAMRGEDFRNQININAIK
ncbi:MAG TPA: aminotransferase class IV [Bacteroidales bacterium]|nr:aminotransferase class IV [Bacteroidales bacterium]